MAREVDLVVLDYLTRFAVNPECIRDVEHEAVLAVGQVDGDEETIAQHDPFPIDVKQGSSVPDLVEGSVAVGFIDQDDVADVFMVVGIAW